MIKIVNMVRSQLWKNIYKNTHSYIYIIYTENEKRVS